MPTLNAPSQVVFLISLRRGETMDNIDLDRHALAKGIPLLVIVLFGMAVAIAFFL